MKKLEGIESERESDGGERVRCEKGIERKEGRGEIKRDGVGVGEREERTKT